jgi:hypothetical protein
MLKMRPVARCRRGRGVDGFRSEVADVYLEQGCSGKSLVVLTNASRLSTAQDAHATGRGVGNLPALKPLPPWRMMV